MKIRTKTEEASSCRTHKGTFKKIEKQLSAKKENTR